MFSTDNQYGSMINSATKIKINSLQKYYPESFNELIMKCTNPDYKIKNTEILRQCQILDMYNEVIDEVEAMILSNYVEQKPSDNITINESEMTVINSIDDIQPFVGRFVAFKAPATFCSPKELYLSKMYGYIRLDKKEEYGGYQLCIVGRDKSVSIFGLFDKSSNSTQSLKLCCIDAEEAKAIKQPIEEDGYTFLPSGELVYMPKEEENSCGLRSRFNKC